MLVCAGIYDKTYEPLAEKTLYENRLSYCLKHGYPYIFVRHPFLFSNTAHAVKEIGFSKIELALYFLRFYDVVWITDCDAMVMNKSVGIEDVLEKYPSDVLVGSDFNGPNCGNMIFKNAPRVVEYLKFMLRNREGYFHEQDFIWRNPRDFVFATPQNVMNSYDYSLYPGQELNPGGYKPGDFFIHWPAQSLEKRLELYSTWKDKVWE